jgi:hypothetical protein
VAGSDASLEEVLAGAANIEVFAVFMAPTEAFQGPFASEELFEIQPSGELFASGPLDLDVEHIAGMCILHAPSRQDASASPTRSLVTRRAGAPTPCGPGSSMRACSPRPPTRWSTRPNGCMCVPLTGCRLRPSRKPSKSSPSSFSPVHYVTTGCNAGRHHDGR